MELPQDTWFVIAAFNEANRIGPVLQELSLTNAEIVVVDDFSSDETSSVCAQYRCHLLRHPINLGQGAALQTGMEYAKNHGASIVVHFDGDGQMQLKDVPALIEPLTRGTADIALGSRYLHPTNEVPWSKRWFIHKPAIYLQLAMTGLKLTDAHCGMRALSRNALEKCRLRQNRMAHATEILELIHRHGLRYCEVPVDIRYHRYGQGFKKGLAVLVDLFVSRFS